MAYSIYRSTIRIPIDNYDLIIPVGILIVKMFNKRIDPVGFIQDRYYDGNFVPKYVPMRRSFQWLGLSAFDILSVTESDHFVPKERYNAPSPGSIDSYFSSSVAKRKRKNKNRLCPLPFRIAVASNISSGISDIIMS